MDDQPHPASAWTDPDGLEVWVHDFLRGPRGNLALAEGLAAAPRRYHGPIWMPLRNLGRCCGPEPGLAFPEAAEVFERRVGALVDALGRGEDLPPLVLEFSEGALKLADGNHRHEALVRTGHSSWPAVVWTTGPRDTAEFEAVWGPWVAVDRAHHEGLTLGRHGVVGCLVIEGGRVFAQKHSADRKTFPGCWDLVGGHVEEGETPYEALVRELAEETGWELDQVLGLRRVVDWEAPGTDGPRLKREFVLAVTIRSGANSPRLEAGKVTEGRWFGPDDLATLAEGRGSDTYVYDLVAAEFARRPPTQEVP